MSIVEHSLTLNVEEKICAMHLGWWTTKLSLLALLVNNALTQSQLNNQGSIEKSSVEQCAKNRLASL